LVVKLHDLGSWVLTREDALTEAYYLKNWFRGSEEDAWGVMMNLVENIDANKGALYVDRHYTAKTNTHGR
jgi:hypothetical protein